MKPFRRVLALSLLLAACRAAPDPVPAPALAASTASVAAPSAAVAALAGQLAAIDAGGRFGFAALHLETGQHVELRGAERFPMQSVFKLPLAITLLARVDAGQERLDEKLLVHPLDLRSGPNDPDALRAGESYTIADLMTRMVQKSDNTATDLLLARVGGPAAIMSRLRASALPGIDVSRSEGQLILEAHGVPYAPATAARDAADAAIAALSPAARRAASVAYLADARDTATPQAMIALLAALQRGTLLSAASTKLLLETLHGTKTGPNRLSAGLPAGTPLAHKTGTSDRFENLRDALGDVGLVTLPDGSHVAVAAFVSHSTGGDERAERAMADAARLVYTVFTSP